jgi:hypothetical protein
VLLVRYGFEIPATYANFSGFTPRYGLLKLAGYPQLLAASSGCHPVMLVPFHKACRN